MRILKTIAIILAVMTLSVGSALATSERSMTPPANFDMWSDVSASFRGTIGYGDIKSDPDAHGKTIWGDSSVTPELGDSVVSTAAVAGLCAAALAGVAVADKKRRVLAK